MVSNYSAKKWKKNQILWQWVKQKKDKTQPNRCKKRPFQNKTNIPLKSKLPPISSSMFLLIYMFHTKKNQIHVKCWNLFFFSVAGVVWMAALLVIGGILRSASWEEYRSHIFALQKLSVFYYLYLMLKHNVSLFVQALKPYFMLNNFVSSFWRTRVVWALC